MCQSENYFQKSVPSCHLLGPEYQIQAMGVGSRHLYLLSHHTGLGFSLRKLNQKWH